MKNSTNTIPRPPRRMVLSDTVPRRDGSPKAPSSTPVRTPPDAPKSSELSESSDIWTTNRPPLDSEISCLQHVLAEKLAEKKLLDAEIAALRASFKDIDNDRILLEEEIEIHKGALSPLRRLPTELLSLIFADARPPHSPAPWTISQVCRRWRAITFSQPSLWAFILVDFTLRAPVQIRLELQLQRSAGSLLRISFSTGIGYVPNKYSVADEGRLLGILVAHSARWERVELRTKSEVLSCAHLERARGRLPNLQRLDIYSKSLQSPGPGKAVVTDAFELAPKLRQASIKMGPANHDVRLPFSQLERYCASGPWNDQRTASLISSSNLVDCSLHIDKIITRPATPISLPQLRRLCLHSSRLLDMLDTPNLEELYCGAKEDHLSTLLKQRGYRLRKLVMFYPAMVPEVAAVLRAVPTITNMGLCIHGWHLKPLSTALTVRDKKTDVGPALAELVLCSRENPVDIYHSKPTPYADDGSNEKMLLAMIESRWRGGTGNLQRVFFEGDHHYMADGRMKRMHDEGLDIGFVKGWHGEHLDMFPADLHLSIDVL